MIALDDRIARGVNFMYAKDYVVETQGAAAWARVLDRLPPDAAAVWRGTIVPINAYSFSSFKALVGAIAAETGGQSDEGLAKMYEHIADRSLSALYKVFFKFANPAYVVRNYPKLWSRFFTAGTVEVPEAAAGAALVRFTLPEIFLDWLPAACLGYSTKAVTMAGGRGVTVEEVARDRQPSGEWAVSYQIRWQELT